MSKPRKPRQGRPSTITAETVRDGIARGLTLAQIAHAAGITERTVRRRMDELQLEDPSALLVAKAAVVQVPAPTSGPVPSRRELLDQAARVISHFMVHGCPEEQITAAALVWRHLPADEGDTDEIDGEALLERAIEASRSADPSTVPELDMTLASGGEIIDVSEVDP